MAARKILTATIALAVILSGHAARPVRSQASITSEDAR